MCKNNNNLTIDIFFVEKKKDVDALENFFFLV